MVRKQAFLFWTITIVLAAYSHETVERIVTTTHEYLDGKCCQKKCLEVKDAAECNNWKDSILEVNKQQSEITEERVRRLEAKYREVLELRRKAEENRKAQLDKIREQLNATWQLKKAELKAKLSAEVERVRNSCARARQIMQDTAEKGVPDGGTKHRPENCSVVCNDVITGKIANDPVGFATSGTAQRIFPSFNTDKGVLVYCDCTNGSNEAWTVFQRRLDGSVDFYRNWANYSEGFGNVTGEFWLGLNNIAAFTSSQVGYILRVDLENWDGSTHYAEYRNFSVSTESTNYTLTFDSYSGDAGDSLTYHNMMQFSTFDRINHADAGSVNCAEFFHGAWWFNNCYSSHLNGRYFHEYEIVTNPPLGIAWYHWTGWSKSLKAAEMKFKANV